MEHDKFIEGISLGLVFIITGIILPLFFFSKGLLVVCSILISLGIAALGIELEKVERGHGFSDFLLGIGFLLSGISIVLLFPNFVIKIISLILIVIGLYGSILGILKLINQIKNDTNYLPEINSSSSKIKIIYSAILSLTGFIANIVTVISFLFQA